MIVLEKSIVPVDFATRLPIDQLPAYDAPVFHMWDIDGTLIDTEKVLQRMEQAGKHFHLAPGSLRAMNTHIRKSGGSFNARGHIHDMLVGTPDEAASFARWEQEFRTLDQPDILYEDAIRILDLQTAYPAMPHMFMTYGDTDNQINKTIAMGRQGFVYTMPHSLKGPVIASDVRNSRTGRYDSVGFSADGLPVAIYRAGRGRLTDDKKKSLRDGPNDTDYDWLRRPNEKPTRSQLEGQLPAGARQIASLDEIEIIRRLTPANDIARRLGALPQTVAFVPLQLFEHYRN